MTTLRQLAKAVSTPGHALYGRHPSVEEIRRLTAPESNHVGVVLSWLRDHGLQFTQTNERLTVSATVMDVETLLATRVLEYQRHVDGRTIYRASDYSLPATIAAATTKLIGLHGVPLPPRLPIVHADQTARMGPATVPVTPSVVRHWHSASVACCCMQAARISASLTAACCL